MTVWQMEQGQELPARTIDWYDADGTPVDFSSGWTFTVKVSAIAAPTTTLVTKTSGITGAATVPNVTIDWSTSELSSLTAAGARYVVRLIARRTADSKDRVFRPGDPIVLQLFSASN